MCGKMTCKVKSLLSQDHFLGEVLYYLVERNIYIYICIYIHTYTYTCIYRVHGTIFNVGEGGAKIALKNVAHHVWATKKMFCSKVLRDSKTASFLL